MLKVSKDCPFKYQIYSFSSLISLKCNSQLFSVMLCIIFMRYSDLTILFYVIEYVIEGMGSSLWSYEQLTVFYEHTWISPLQSTQSRLLWRKPRCQHKFWSKRRTLSILGCAVNFRFEAKRSETQAKFFSLRSETEGVLFLVSLGSEIADFTCEMKRKWSKTKRKKQSETKRKKQSERNKAKLKGKNIL